MTNAAIRGRLAEWIIGLSVAGMILISTVAIWLATDESRPEMSRLVFTSILPLLGTWVGTVLAFYFARENLQAATDSVAQLASQFTETTSVLEAMIPKAQITSATAANAAAAGNLLLSDLEAAMTAGQRLPILTPAGEVLYVVHKSSIDSYRSTLASPALFAGKKLSDLLAVAPLKSAVEAIAVVGPTALLKDARTAMHSVPKCNDVFVTADGGRQSPILGWLTNTLLAAIQ
jgi:hypothetical protein